MGKKLGIVVPYRDREDHINKFIPHMIEFFNGKDIDYKLIVVEQEDDLPFNYGKLCNIGFDYYKKDFDYFCFHDVDLLPVTDDCDYSFKNEPVGIATHVDIWNYELPYPEYFGGAILMTKEHFNKINGFSNEYWGWGYGDLDLLERCRKNKLPLRTFYECGNHISQEIYEFSKLKIVKRQYSDDIPYIKFNGKDWLTVLGSDVLYESLDNSFSISALCNPSGTFRESEYQGTVICRQGYDTKIVYTSDNKFVAELWDDSSNCYKLFSLPKLPNEWYNVVLTYDHETKLASLYVNGIKEDTIATKNEPYKYDTRVPYYIGVPFADNKTKIIDREPFIGKISYMTLWDSCLNDTEVYKLFLNGAVDQSLNWIGTTPLFHITPKHGFNRYLLDVSGFKHHGKFYSELEKKNIKVGFDHINKCTEIKLPTRISGTFKAIRHKNDKNIAERLFSFDPDIQENKNIFLEEVRTGELDTNTIGLNNLKYKVFEHDYNNENVKWLKVQI